MKTLATLFCVVFLSIGGAPLAAEPATRSAAGATGSDSTTSGSWQLDLSCGSACATTLHAISMVTATDGWAVGDEGVIVHWDGTRWQPAASPTTKALYAVDMVSADDGWAVGGSATVYGGQGIILHWDGSAWQEVTMPAQVGLHGVAMVSHDDGWAVGFRSYYYGLGYNYILHWNGASWQVHD